MKKVGKKLALVLSAAIMAVAFAACSSDSESESENTSNQTVDTGSTGTADSGSTETVVKALEFVSVAGGTVTGASYTDNWKGVFIEGRTVTLSSFYMSKYEVTQAQYKAVMEGKTVTVNGAEKTLNASPSYFTGSNVGYEIDYGVDHSNHPVEGVTWYDAVYFCNALSEKEGLDPCYTISVTNVDDGNIKGASVTFDNTKNGYRLPTEAEWEYAARGGNPSAPAWNYTFSGADKAEGTMYSAAKNIGLDSVGWYCYNNISGTSGDSDVTITAKGCGTHEVGKKAANALGLYDMSGNVSEWCYDWYDGSIAAGDEINPSGAASGFYRVYRGGSWNNSAYYVSVSNRNFWIPNDWDNYVGFRVVRSNSN